MTALEALKAYERKESVYLVMNDPEMKRLILAWTVYGSVLNETKQPARRDDFNANVKAAWHGCSPICMDRVANMADMACGTAKQKMEILIMHGLIYPDGTANENALLIIRADVRAGLQKIAGTTKKKGANHE